MSSPLAFAHWDSTGTYGVKAVGTSFYRESLEAIAQNPNGKHALTICLAYLIPEKLNQHDPNAVRVVIEGKTVGHLAKDYAAEYRSLFSELSYSLPRTSVMAAITGGLRSFDREYEYTLELDIPDSLKLHPLSSPLEQEIIRVNGYPPLTTVADGTHEVKVWVPVPNLDELHSQRRIKEWTTDTWDTVNFYVENRRAIGLGFKLYELGKPVYFRLFGSGPTHCELSLNNGRIATLRIQAAAIKSSRSGAPSDA